MSTSQYYQFPKVSSGGASGVSSLNSLTGALTLVAGTGITVTPSGSNITIAATGAGSGTVTSVSVVSANGFNGSVATATTTPAITLTTTITGLLKGNGTAISAATSGTDYSGGTSALGTGILKSTTGTGALTIAVPSDFPTLNQNTTGTAANVTGIVALVNGGTGVAAGSANAAFNALSPMTSVGDLILGSTAGAAVRLGIGSNTFVLTSNGTTASWVAPATAGTVTSVSATVPAFLSISGSPITGSGTLAFGLSGTALPIANGGTGVTSVTTSPVATAFVGWDANKNVSANSTIEGYTTTVTAAGTTTLTVASSYSNFLTGTTTQTVVLPAANTLVLGQQFYIVNNSTGTVTVNANGGGLVISMAGNTTVLTTVTNVSSGAGVWSVEYSLASAVGTVTSVAATVPAFLSISGSPITTSGTLAIGLSGTALPIANGGTAATSAAAAYNNLSPMTTTGDMEYESGTNTAARLAIGATGQVLQVVGGVPAWTSVGVVGTASQQTRTGVTGYGSTNTKILIFGTSVTSTGTDITYATSAANGDSYTINTAGTYAISISVSGPAITATFGASVNSGQLTTSISSITNSNILIITDSSAAGDFASGSYIGNFNVGDVVRPHSDGTAGQNTNNNRFTITKVNALSITNTLSTISTTTTLVNNNTYLCNTSSAAFTVTLPTPTLGASITLKDSTGSFNTNNLTVAQHASEKIEGLAASKILTGNWESVTFTSNGTDWFMI